MASASPALAEDAVAVTVETAPVEIAATSASAIPGPDALNAPALEIQPSEQTAAALVAAEAEAVPIIAVAEPELEPVAVPEAEPSVPVAEAATEAVSEVVAAAARDADTAAAATAVAEEEAPAPPTGAAEEVPELVVAEAEAAAAVAVDSGSAPAAEAVSAAAAVEPAAVVEVVQEEVVPAPVTAETEAVVEAAAVAEPAEAAAEPAPVVAEAEVVAEVVAEAEVAVEAVPIVAAEELPEPALAVRTAAEVVEAAAPAAAAAAPAALSPAGGFDLQSLLSGGALAAEAGSGPSAEALTYGALGAAALSFVATFFVAPRFKEAFKEPVDWRDMYAALSARGVRTVTAEEAYAKAKKGAVILDVRLADKYAVRSALPSVNVQLYQPIAGWDAASNVRRAGFAFFGIFGTELNASFIDEVAAKIPKNKEIIVMCETGGTIENKPGTQFGFQSRSLKALYYLQQAGYGKVLHMKGGLADWGRAGLPLSDDPADGEESRGGAASRSGSIKGRSGSVKGGVSVKGSVKELVSATTRGRK